ncbi:MAG TPA: GDP-mannose 4,6-dehydratase [Candidatus Paceibacterota bacterium]|nr:GDP-mannose 4,6-dehydratase [Verrucomicrobiota bacterium]HOX01459.1 GDP-mannose 4,6-dehydratase [Verrucomicrobiota bacterium]HRZ44418.1 GDP-mannose 4,6-dehydratase [Candidatus Paceibacterota bacterium]
MERALITGITGQDGSYLAELLIDKGYEVHGLVRRTSSLARDRIDHLWGATLGDHPRLFLHYGDLTDTGSLVRLLGEVAPREVYNLAAQSHVGISFAMPDSTIDINGGGTARVLEAIRLAGRAKRTRFFQASSSEMYGNAREAPQSERTPFAPRSPYACSKLLAHWLVVNYREAYGLHASNGILFNHESPRRGENFVTRKITQGAARIKHGLQTAVHLGNIGVRRDWGYAPEYVEAMWRILQQEQPDDYVIATGESHTVRSFAELAFEYVGLDWREHVVQDHQYDRPSEVDLLVGDSSKAKRLLAWEPKTRMADLVRLMMDSDLRAVEALPRRQ